MNVAIGHERVNTRIRDGGEVREKIAEDAEIKKNNGERHGKEKMRLEYDKDITETMNKSNEHKIFEV